MRAEQTQLPCPAGGCSYLQARDGGGVRGQRGRGQVPAQQGRHGRGAGRVRGSPVGFQVLGQVLTGVLQLVLVQDHVKHVLGTGTQRGSDTAMQHGGHTAGKRCPALGIRQGREGGRWNMERGME